ncbi:tetratricopeptide repeat protein [Chitinophaga sp. GCM10012297]|uniref:Tetratricopeptide repeat protein n=1 Tax=Chitinophaga chungangae TaxID=2821488 RepID=A0ABS3YKM7_9BACT|nr:tetratricopeptide repeat protein [Chitinophaga chungangae]MBO9155252.1 tetratricopeptide repeat protein [Chitinophaga chungangae]
MFLYRILLYLCILLPLCRISASATTAGHDRGARQLYEQGVRLKLSGRLQEAEERFAAAIRANHNYAAPYLELANLYRLQHQPETAKQQLLLLLEQHASHGEALGALAEIFFEQKAYEDALTYAFKARDQGAPHMNSIIGLSYSALDHPAEAIRALELALLEEPGQPVLLCRIARLHAQNEDYEQALIYYEKALKADSTSASVYYESGMMHFNMKNYKNAAGAFEQAARLGHPGNADLYVNLGLSQLKQSAFDDAIRNLQAALSLRPKDIQIMQSLANAYYKKQDYTQAAVQWNNILMLQPMNAFAMFMLGKSYICSGEVAKGQNICDQAMQLQ